MKLAFAREAEADLARIGDWIAQDSPLRAAAFVSEIEERCRRLTSMPRAHPLVPRYETRGVRRAPHGDYLIFYRIIGDTVEVVHVLHGRRDYEKTLFPQG
jgi:toxin ParE1/3/4